MKKQYKFSAEAGLGLPTSRSASSKKSYPYTPWGSYSEKYNTLNGYPDLLAQLATDSPTHSAAIKIKQDMIKGDGFNTDELSVKLSNFLEGIGGEWEDANDLLAAIANDYAIYDGFAFRVQYNTAGQVANLEYVPFGDTRAGKAINNGVDLEVPYYVVSNNWNNGVTAQYETCYALNTFNPEVFAEGVLFDEESNEYTPTEEQEVNYEQIVYFFNKKPRASSGQLFYPIPSYIGGIDSILTEREIGVANKSAIDNGFGGKYVVVLPTNNANEEEKATMYNDLMDSFAGASKDGLPVVVFADSTSEEVMKPEIDKIDSLDADTYKNLEESVKQSIVTTHNIPAILLNLSLSGGFNNRGEEMTVAFQQYQQTTIKQYQDNILRVLRKVLAYAGFSKNELAKLTINPFELNIVKPDTNE